MDVSNAIHASMEKVKNHTGTYWIGIAGIPGAGKSTIASLLVKAFEDVGIHATALPMDGYHYYLKELDSFPDPELAHFRRGAPFTFNAEKFIRDLTACKNQGHGRFPSFDHAQKDPVEESIHVDETYKVIIVEGNYLLLSEPDPWPKVHLLFDETWLLQVPIPVASERLAKRHQLAWNWPLEKCIERVDASDRLNMILINEHVIPPTRYVNNDI